ncbi:MAG: DUF2784 domain-containing protein [Desulfobacteraceae bacterium]|nr:DUF2784 domain-containing protein [Desulfobacteraceae bacterium]
MYRLLADLTLVIHLLFVLFVIFGGLVMLRWPRTAILHLPAALWGAVVELSGWLCPLTPLENYFLEQSGAAGYRTGFIEHYLLPLIYPGKLTREMQVFLGVAVVVVNGLLYGLLLLRLRRKRGRPSSL